MKKVILLFLLVLLVPNGKVLMQEISDCMCMPYSYPPHNPEYFLDSAFLIDTCNITYKSQDCDTAMWLNCFTTFDFRERIYAKEKWAVEFDVIAFDLPYYDRDTIIYVSWRDVDSINYPEIKDSLKMIENDYGYFTMRKEHPDIIQPGIGQRFIISFSNYVNGVEVENKFNAIPNSDCDFKSGIYYIEDIDDYSQNGINSISISPNPASEYIEINLVNVVETGLRPVSTGFSEEIRIYNALGECVLSSEIHPMTSSHRMNIENLPSGVYFIRIGDAVKSFVKI